MFDADAEDPSGDCGTSPVGGRRRQFIPSVSSALVVGAVLGLLQALLLGLAAKPFLRIMGVKPVRSRTNLHTLRFICVD